jgi:vanillate O-demethylase ferredoxin subunit
MVNQNHLRVRVARKSSETPEISTFELVSADGAGLPPFSAGAHIDVDLPNGLTRQYSLCNDQTESHRYLIGVLKDSASRGGSKAMHESVNEGDLLQISPPKNHFPLTHGAKKSLLLAGGIGVTPILCMAERLANIQEDFTMHYCTRSAERTAFLKRIETSPFAEKVAFHFDDEVAKQKLDLDTLLADQGADVHLYVCGPKGFMDAVLGAARARGWPEGRLHYEFFAAEVVRSNADQTFKVKLGSSGRVIEVKPEQTVIEALGDAGIEVPTSCEQGVCGTCLTRVLEGQPDHRDSYLTPEEQGQNDQFLPCCSRSKSPMLVLDL